MDYKELMAAFAENIGIEELPIVDGATSLDVDDMRVEVIHDEKADGVLLGGIIGEPPPEGQGLFASMLLQANFLFQGTGGATIGQNPETKEYALMRTFALKDLDVDAFSDALGNFVNELERWRGLLAGFQPIGEQLEKTVEEEQALPLASFIQV